jgi:hypothetical protein
MKCVIYRDPLTYRWIVLNDDDTTVAWSGARWVRLYGDVQVSNFATWEDGVRYANGFGFEVLGEDVLRG